MAWSRSARPGDEATPHRLLVRRALLLALVLALAVVCGSVAVRLLRAATISAPAKPVASTPLAPAAPAGTPARPDRGIGVTGLPAPAPLVPLGGGPAVP